MKKILTTVLALVMMLTLTAGCGSGDKKAAYPQDGDITVVIPKAPGGGTDVSARHDPVPAEGAARF